MHLLILSEAFPPETKSCATLFFELAESLVRRGHKVSVVTRKPLYNVAEGTDLKALPNRETIAGINVFRYQTPPLVRTSPFFRGVEHFLLAIIFFLGGLRVKKVDAILIYSPPLTLGLAGYWLGRMKRSPLISNIQDLYPQTVIDLGLLNNKSLIKLSQIMEKFVYKKSDYVAVHSAGNKDYVVTKGAKEERVKIAHNWVNTLAIQPGARDNDFSRKYDLKDKFVVSFAGVMGFAQGLDVVVRAAEILQRHKIQDTRLRTDNIKFVLVGDGVKKPALEAQVKELGLTNVLFVPTQPHNLYPLILHSSDVSLVTLRKALATPVVPSKLLSIMAAGLPAIVSVSCKSDAVKIVAEHNCGLSVEAENPAELAQAVLKLYNDKKLRDEMGQNGRQAAEKYFSREACVTSFENIIKEAVK
ncbi:hypothetical protein A2291_02990 [candidate division WOR-1 bacterium RIFOXYB2_FULL_42_35]|uniref:Glycosyltransferase WbuB n=1 Tax=candidate division WOR-1 bacterium RIFOXYC2_FULL_41_25 TaxID=1802586 RepID=A0A1F4TQW8_UNCSA|nr:MAG: hypothetical protein A2247_01300 [candidate division WOR-1 bacterium RIFOXYA2_FULL_41_14]OGC25713.1 MAG: hypothetical protein A2291_02990 [candidate division WOR-1 bacterium RIFOXYB2_FULL_42_35]OGC35115.1 MAG: hypothetical protein A2462_06135 [candidate division WOR-1 bacterium RIFOXYC2_FULL_41_25]OGC41472.1 MAG: hypothetical protein A2548_07115 [candidate division WOR-1 bacterium RIFOXYD2_FULL_41_8]